MRNLSVLVTIGFVLLISVGWIGCLSQIIQEGTGGEKLLDYATAETGATVVASMSMPGHEAETTINGITSSEDWDKGEGWGVQFDWKNCSTCFEGPVAGTLGGAWIEVHFPKPERVNRIVIHTLDSSDYPASRYGIYSGVLRVWREKRWETLGRIKKGKIEYRTQASYGKPAGGKIEFRFSPITIAKVRFDVYRSNDRKIVGRTFGIGIEESTARIVEIEVTGNESVDTIAEIQEFPSFDDEENPIF